MTTDLTPVELDALSTALSAAFGPMPWINTCHVRKRLDEYFVVEVDLGPRLPPVVVKLAGAAATLSCPFEATAAVNRLVRAHGGVPTFEVLAAGEVPQWRYLVMTQMPGVPWDLPSIRFSDLERQGLQLQLGRVVGAMQAIPFPAFGEFETDGTVRADGSYAEALAARSARRIRDPSHCDLMLRLIESHRAELDECHDPVLSHEDLNPGNLLIVQTDGSSRLSAILDFESAWAGSAESDLARLEIWNMTADPFWTGYLSSRELPRRAPEVTLVHQLLWCVEYTHPTKSHLADTTRICRALDIEPVVF